VKRLALVLALSSAALALAACSPASPPVSSEPPLPQPVESSATVEGLTYVLGVPAATLEASTGAVAIYSVTNSTDDTVTGRAQMRLTITAPDGSVVVDTIPPGSRFLATGVVLGPGDSFQRSVPFRVPIPGSCTVALPQVIDPVTGRELSVEFESVEAL